MALFKRNPLQIIPFRSYGTFDHFYAKGRALEDGNIDLGKKGLVSMLLIAYKRFKTVLIKNTHLSITLPNGEIIETKTDDQGYFLIDRKIKGLREMADDEGLLKYTVSFNDNIKRRIIQHANIFEGEVLIPSEKARFGIISDVDDTIIHTGLTSRLKFQVLKNTLFKRASKRIPLEGAPDFYNRLHTGKSGVEGNPVFYVSHGPWNLYQYLDLFLKLNDFPKGAILLRDFVNPLTKLFKPRAGSAEKPQKQKEILNLLKAYPQLPFILIGDSGEHDPDIYIEIAEAHPERILAIYMRSVNHRKRMIRVRGLFKDYETVPVLLVDDGKEALKHAREMGFIS